MFFDRLHKTAKPKIKAFGLFYTCCRCVQMGHYADRISTLARIIFGSIAARRDRLQSANSSHSLSLHKILCQADLGRLEALAYR